MALAQSPESRTLRIRRAGTCCRIACLVGSGLLPAVARAAVEHPATPVQIEIERTSFTVSWSAIVPEDGGTFRLYDLSGDRPEVVAERAATRGSRSYSLELEAHDREQRLELRYAAPAGDEQVLEAVVVRYSAARGAISLPLRSSPSLLTAASDIPAASAASRADSKRSVATPSELRPEPEIPPPLA